MTTATDEGRLGILEGRMTEQAAAIAGLRDDVREIRAALREVSSRIDRLFLAVLTIGAGVGAAQIGLLVTLILRT